MVAVLQIQTVMVLPRTVIYFGLLLQVAVDTYLDGLLDTIEQNKHDIDDNEYRLLMNLYLLYEGLYRSKDVR